MPPPRNVRRKRACDSDGDDARDDDARDDDDDDARDDDGGALRALREARERQQRRT